MLCSKCKGTGEVKSGYCDKCYGKGNFDWIENVVGKKLKGMESITNISDRLLLLNIQKHVEKVIEEFKFKLFDKITQKKLTSHLEKNLNFYKTKQFLHDYKIDTDQFILNSQIDINIKLTNTLEHINLSFKIL